MLDSALRPKLGKELFDMQELYGPWMLKESYNLKDFVDPYMEGCLLIART